MKRYLSTDGTNGDAWPSPWVTDFVTAAGTQDINGDKLRQVNSATAGSIQRAKHTGVFTDDFEIVYRVTPGNAWSLNSGVPFVSVGGPDWITSNDGCQNGYGFFLQGSAALIRIYRISAGSGSVAFTAAYTFSSSVPVWVRARRQGAHVMMKGWNDGTAEPATWTIGGSHTTPISAVSPQQLYVSNTGGVGFTFSYDNLSIDDLHAVKVHPNQRRF